MNSDDLFRNMSKTPLPTGTWKLEEQRLDTKTCESCGSRVVTDLPIPDGTDDFTVIRRCNDCGHEQESA
jgi:hypothetical protein